jgi:hypothetical protein
LRQASSFSPQFERTACGVLRCKPEICQANNGSAIVLAALVFSGAFSLNVQLGYNHRSILYSDRCVTEFVADSQTLLLASQHESSPAPIDPNASSDENCVFRTPLLNFADPSFEPNPRPQWCGSFQAQARGRSVVTASPVPVAGHSLTTPFSLSVPTVISSASRSCPLHRFLRPSSLTRQRADNDFCAP